MGATPQAIEQRENLFKKYKSVLHPKNSYMQMMRSALGTLYGKVDGYILEDLPDLLLERKIELLQALLEALNVIEPGCTRMRGKTHIYTVLFFFMIFYFFLIRFNTL